MVEGTLDVLWENYTTPNATPKYRLLFARYKDSKSGAQQTKRLVGADALESHLIAINFAPDYAKNCVKEVHKKNSLSILNVMMPEQYLADYGQ